MGTLLGSLLGLLALAGWVVALWAWRRPPWGISAGGSASRGWEDIALRVVVHNLGISPIRIPREGHSVEFPFPSKARNSVAVSVIDLNMPNANPIFVPPFGSVELGTDVFHPAVTVVAGQGLANEPHFELCLRDQWGREVSTRFLLPDTLVKAVPNPISGRWDYPEGPLVLNPRAVGPTSVWGKYLAKRASKGGRGDIRRKTAWPDWPEQADQDEPMTYETVPSVQEDERVVAFIDILGFRELMRSDDAPRRAAAIHLLDQLVQNSSNHGIKVRDLALGAQVSLDPEVSTFSDNVVLSIPLKGVSYRTPAGIVTEPTSSFMPNILSVCVGTFWQGLHLGLLFRGGISVGRLYHQSNVVAGEGLVDAVELEKKAEWPRIVVDPRVLDATDADGRPVVEEHIRELIVQDPDDGLLVLDTLRFHIGVWWDYFHFRTGKPEIPSWQHVQMAVRAIQQNTTKTISSLETELDSASPERQEIIGSALAKWRWFDRRFSAAQQAADWGHVWVEPVAPITSGPYEEVTDDPDS